MMAGLSDVAESVSKWTNLMSMDCSREYGVFGPSDDDTESWRERLIPITWWFAVQDCECWAAEYESGLYLL